MIVTGGRRRDSMIVTGWKAKRLNDCDGVEGEGTQRL